MVARDPVLSARCMRLADSLVGGYPAPVDEYVSVSDYEEDEDNEEFYGDEEDMDEPDCSLRD